MGWQIVYIPFLFAGDTIINQNGVFIYDGTPTLGNLKVSIAGTAGVDQFGNVYTDNVAAYNIANSSGGYAQIASNPSTGIPFLVLNPPGATVLNAFPQVNSDVVNSGAANELYQINVNSGDTTGQGAAGAAILQLLSRSNDGTVASQSNTIADVAKVTLQDGNAYDYGDLLTIATPVPQTINQTAAAVINGCGPFNVIARAYKFIANIQFAGNQAAGTANFQIGVSGATESKPSIVGETHDTAVGTTAYTSRGALGPVTSSTLTTNAWTCTITAWVTFTSAGSISLQAFCSVAADTFNITSCLFEIIPMF